MRFSKPVTLRDGTQLGGVTQAKRFIEELPLERMSPLLYYAYVLLDQAREAERLSNVERAREEFIRALRAVGWV
jgi:hypothetical protein